MSACVRIYIHRQMFVRPETIDRPTHERPSNKTFFSLCDVCITNCLASTIFLSIVILILVRFPSTDRTECERIHQRELREVNYFAINLFLQTRPLDATRGAFTSKFTFECASDLSSPHSKSLRIHCVEIIIFIARHVFI